MSSSIGYIDDKNGNHVFPVTHERAVRDSDGVTLETKLGQKQNTIQDISTIRSGAAAGATAVQPAALDAKQDVISDLQTIRSGAALGSTSVQPVDIEDMVEAEPIGSIIPPVNPSEFATKVELSQLGQQVIYDVTMNNSNHPTFDSLLALLSDANLSTLIPANVRCGGMSIRFVQTSDNKYVQYFLTKNTWSVSEGDWQKMNLEEEVSQLGQKLGATIGEYDSSMSNYATDYASVFKTPFDEDVRIKHIKTKVNSIDKIQYAIVGLTDGIISSIDKHEIAFSGYVIDDDVNILIPAGKLLFVKGCTWASSTDYEYYSALDSLNVACGTFALKTSVEIIILSDSLLKNTLENAISNVDEKTEYSDSTLNTYIQSIKKNDSYDISSWQDSAYNVDIYYREINYTGKLQKVKIKSPAAQTVGIYSCELNTSASPITQTNKVLLAAIHITEGEHEYDLSSLDISVAQGRFIGVAYQTYFYFSLLQFNTYRERNGEVIESHYSTAEEFYIYRTEHVTDFNIESLAKLADSLSNNIETLQDDVNDTELLKKFSWGKLYGSSNFSDWEDWDSDDRGAWSKNGNTITPTAIGGYDNNSMCGGIVLNQMYQSLWKRYMFDVVLYSDTILNIHFARTINTGPYPNESMFRINFADSKLQMMSNIDRYITNTVYCEKSIDIPIVNGGVYIVEVSRIDTTFYLKLTNKTSGESVELVNSNNWGAGTMQDKIGFTWGAGATPPVISNVRIYEPQDVELIFVGDSITEGYGMVQELGKRFDALCLKDIKNSFISAASSDTIADATNRINNELSKNKPKYLCVLLGTNNVDNSISYLTQWFTELKTACDAKGISLILNHIPMLNGKTAECIALNGVIDSFNLDGAKFDIATAINNDPSQGCDTSLFVDGCHPNTLGSQKMYERMRIDLPYLFDN